MTAHAQGAQLDRCVSAVWRRSQLLVFLQGALVFAAWAVMLFLFGLLIDKLFGVPAVGRWVIGLTVVGVSAVKGWRAGWQKVRRFDAARAALQIEDRCGGMDSLLISAVQFRDAATRSGHVDGLSELTCRRAEEAVASLKVSDIVRLEPLRQPAIGAVIALLLLGGLAIADGATLKVGAARIFTPWLAVEYPTRTQLKQVTGDMVVQEGKPVRIAAQIAGVIPDKARIALRTGSGRPRLADLPIDGAACAYQIDTVFRDFDYRITAGDARSDWHTVRVVYPPNIEQAQVTLDYPAYTGRSPRTVEALTLTIPETTRIRWKLLLDQPIRHGSVNLAGREPLPMTVSSDGRTVSFELTAADSRAYHFSWVERENGFVFESPSYYLQVAPDRAPRLELTSPNRNLYAMIGRKIDLAFRGRDDHGIAEAFVVYSVDKIEQQKVAFTPTQSADGGEQTIDWDYRTALPDLVEGQSVTLAIEAADRYPGANGPHRVRSESRRIQFVSREQYLAHIDQQKKRLLSRLRTIYREQRQVYEVVLQLNPASPVFVQNCQLEAVRQDLTGERLNKLADRMDELFDDLEANGITDAAITGPLVRLRDDIRMISSDHVTAAAAALRSLAGSSGAGSDAAQFGMSAAARWVDSAARELGLQVLQLGYEDASEVMAREMHAAAQNQANLRLHTIMSPAAAPQLAQAQHQLAAWLDRLFEASPSGSETTVDEALVEFTLTRMIKQLINGGTIEKMAKAESLIRQGGDAERAARLQEQVIAALLKAEFRLRVGAEREALAEALGLFVSQAEQHQTLRSTIVGLDDAAFARRRDELAGAQAELQRHLQLLLLPEIPARRARLFDEVMPAAPVVGERLAAADEAMVASEVALRASDRAAAVEAQRRAEEAFTSLAQIVRRRLAQMTEAVRIERIAYGAMEIDERLELLGERQLGLLERTEDAAADDAPADYLADQQQALAESVEELLALLARAAQSRGPAESSQALAGRIEQAANLMRRAGALLAGNQPEQAAAAQEAADAALSASRQLLAEHNAHLSSYAAMLAFTRTSVGPSGFVGEIEQEQQDLLELTRQTDPDQMPALAVPQKNLVHAVDAILVALDPISHLVETGTVMLFAKADMDAAGVALEEKDSVEALDAQQFIVETLAELRGKIDKVVPQCFYLLEFVEALHESIEPGVLIREDQRKLRETLRAQPDDPGPLVQPQQVLAQRMDAYAQLIHRMAGPGLMQAARAPMAGAHQRLIEADSAGAVSQMQLAEQALRDDTAQLLVLIQRLTLILAPGEPGTEPPAEVMLLREVLSLAAQQKAVYRRSCASPSTTAELAAELHGFAKSLEPFIERATQHQVPEPEEGETPAEPRELQLKLVEATTHLQGAAQAAQAGDRSKAIAGQQQAAESLRHFIADYALLFVQPPPGPSESDPAPTTDFNETEDTMQLFMPGAVTGQRPPDGRLEWQVLGERDRAALNENFARELPLEFRAILKDYYERLAQ